MRQNSWRFTRREPRGVISSPPHLLRLYWIVNTLVAASYITFAGIFTGWPEPSNVSTPLTLPPSENCNSMAGVVDGVEEHRAIYSYCPGPMVVFETPTNHCPEPTCGEGRWGHVANVQ